MPTIMASRMTDAIQFSIRFTPCVRGLHLLVGIADQNHDNRRKDENCHKSADRHTAFKGRGAARDCILTAGAVYYKRNFLVEVLCMTWEKVWVFIRPFTNTALVCVIGYVLVRLLSHLISRPFKRAKFDDSLVRFIVKCVKVVGYVLVFSTALSTLGVPTAGLAATLSGATLAIGVALKDSLSNVAGGIILLFVPRFVTGDYIATNGDEGTVLTVDLMHTTIQTIDNKQVSIPNGVLVNSHITNYSHEKTRRLDLLIPLAYEADVEAAKRVAQEVVAQHPLAKAEPAAPFVRLCNYSEHTMGLTVRVWCDSADYWTLHFDLTEKLHDAFVQSGIALPYRPKADNK